MTYRTRHIAATVVLLAVAVVAVHAQQAANPLIGVWLLSYKSVPLAMLLAFEEDTYDIIGRISFHGANISYTTLDEDKAPRHYVLQDLAIDGPVLTFKISLEGFSYEAMGPWPGTAEVPMPLYLFVEGEIAAELIAIPEIQRAPSDGASLGQPASTPASRTSAGQAPLADGWIATDKGSFKIERFWEETAGSYTATYSVVSYKNTTERTFTSTVTIKAAIYDQNDRLIDTNTRSFFASEHGAMKPGFTGSVKIPIEATKGAAKSVRVTIEVAN